MVKSGVEKWRILVEWGRGFCPFFKSHKLAFNFKAPILLGINFPNLAHSKSRDFRPSPFLPPFSLEKDFLSIGEDSGRRGLNPRPSDYKSDALTTELLPVLLS